MSEIRKPKKPARPATQRGENVLVESLRNEISVVAEGVSGLASRVSNVENSLSDIRAKLDVIEPIARSTAPVPDEVKSIGDVLRKVSDELKMIRFAMATSGDVDDLKTELRLVRSDLSTLDKRLATVEASPS